MHAEESLDDMAELCKACAKSALSQLLELGPKPSADAEALLWEQTATRLQGQINSFSALVTRLTALAVIEGIRPYQKQIEAISEASAHARTVMEQVVNVSDLLTKLARILDLGLAILTVAANPSLAAAASLATAAESVKAI